MVILRRQVKSVFVVRQAGDDAAMFLGESRCLERLPKMGPFHLGILSQTDLLSIRQAVHRSSQGTDGFLDAFVGRRQLEVRVECLEMRPKFFTQRLNEIRLSGGVSGHGAMHHTVWPFGLTMGAHDRGGMQ